MFNGKLVRKVDWIGVLFSCSLLIGGTNVFCQEGWAASEEVVQQETITQEAEKEKVSDDSESIVESSKEQGVVVKSSAICENVSERQPVNEKTSFPEDIGKVYFWTQIDGNDTEPGSIVHAWYYKQVKVGEVPLKVTCYPYRTWSSKTIMPTQAGDWKVEALDDKGNVLKSVNFVIESGTEK